MTSTCHKTSIGLRGMGGEASTSGYKSQPPNGKGQILTAHLGNHLIDFDEDWNLELLSHEDNSMQNFISIWRQESTKLTTFT